MKISALMIDNPITITEDADIEEAISIMKSNSIRHLPVVSGDRIFMGLVTLADLRLGLIPSMVADVSLKDLIIRNPFTVDPDQDIEHAARLIYEKKVSGLPVVKNGKLVGIITETDILRAFVDMMGILSDHVRIDVKMKEGMCSCSDVWKVIHDHGGDVYHMCMAPLEEDAQVYRFRISKSQIGNIRSALEDSGYEVSKAED